ADKLDNQGAIDNSGTVTVADLANAGEIDNAGILAVEDGSNDGDIKGDGTMTIARDFANNGSIEQGQIDVAEDAKVNNSSDITADKLDNQGAIDNSGTVTVADLANAGEVDNAGTLAVKDGTNDGDIKGDGTMTVAGDFANNGKITQKNIDILSDGVLTSEVTKIVAADGINNDGELNIHGARNENDIRGSGVVNINSAMALVGQIGGSNTVNVNEGLLTLEQDNVLGSGIILNVAAQDKDAALAVDDKTINVKEVHFGENSTVNFDIKSLSDFGQIVADTITIAQGAKLHATLGQGLATMNEPSFFPLLKATNTDFNNFTDSYEMAANNMYQFEKEGLDGMYKITLIKTAADVAEDVDAHRDIVDAAHAWVDGNRFADEKGQGIADELAKLAQEDAKGFKKALESLVPSAAPIVKTLSLEHAQYLHDMLVNHLYGQGEQQGIGSGDEVQTIDASAWVKTYAAHSRLDAHNYVAGFDINRRGAVFGLDKLIRKGLRAGFGYGTDTTKAKSSQRRDKVHTHSVFVYGQYKPSDWYVDSLMSYSRGKYSEDKYSMNHKYHASYDVDDIYADAKTGYNFNLYNKWVVTPEGGLEYHYIDRGSYHDNARQKVSSHDMHVLTAAGGVKVSTEFEVDENVLSRSAKVRPEVYLGASYDMVSDRDRAFVSLANGSDYTVHGNQLGRFAVETKVGVKASFEDKVDVSLHYMGNYRSNYRAHAGMLELKVRF
ncbi:MAG: autotransporter domain-containing protein, partial [Alphaproteobacteria bacterium]|nr:autotransporter domain-containing protein [Alphaproteobacteria bacterium]